MMVSMVDNIMDRPVPPTKETIEQERRIQLQVLQTIRRKLSQAQHFNAFTLRRQSA
jgi:hypothetical protein